MTRSNFLHFWLTLLSGARLLMSFNRHSYFPTPLILLFNEPTPTTVNFDELLFFRHKDEIQRASRRIQDDPQSAREVAVFWCEYVVRHRGAPHLRSPAADLSWVQFLLLDVLTVLALALTLLFLVVVWVCRWLSRRTGKIKLEWDGSMQSLDAKLQ